VHASGAAGSTIDGGAAVSVAGFGFDLSRNYTLYFSFATFNLTNVTFNVTDEGGANSTGNLTYEDGMGNLTYEEGDLTEVAATAYPTSYTTIVFVAPKGPAVEQKAVCSLERSSGVAGIRNGTIALDGGVVEYEYVAHWDAAASTWAALQFGGAATSLSMASPATGGVAVTIYGDGFSEDVAYGCVMVGEDGSAARSADVEEVNTTSLVCVSPAWRFAQASTRIHVERRGGDAWTIPLEERADVRFRFAAAVARVAPTAPSTRNLIPVTGDGFDRYISYQCIFTRANISAPDLPEERLVTLTWFSSSSLLHCRNSDWGFLFPSWGVSVAFALAEETSNGLSPDVTIQGSFLAISFLAPPLPFTLEMLPTWFATNLTRSSVAGGPPLLLSTAGLSGRTEPQTRRLQGVPAVGVDRTVVPGAGEAAVVMFDLQAGHNLSVAGFEVVVQDLGGGGLWWVLTSNYSWEDFPMELGMWTTRYDGSDFTVGAFDAGSDTITLNLSIPMELRAGERMAVMLVAPHGVKVSDADAASLLASDAAFEDPFLSLSRGATALATASGAALTSVSQVLGSEDAPTHFAGAVLYTSARIPGLAYTCNFTDRETGLFAEAAPVFPPALDHAPMLATEMVCVAPFWPHGEAATSLTITDSAGKAVEFSGDAPVSLVMASSWRSVAPMSAFARGGAVLTFTGQGFDGHARSSYRARLESTINPSWAAASAPCSVSAWGALLCASPAWPYPAGPVHLNVTRNGVHIDFNPAFAPDGFAVLDGWEFVAPDAAPAAGGTLLDVEAFGLDVDAPPGTYACVFSQSPAQAVPVDGNVSMAVDGVVVAHDALQCTTPVWGATFPAGDIFLHIITASRLVQTLDLDPVGFAFNATATRMSNSALYAEGGQLLEIAGFGFGSEGNGTHAIRFETTQGNPRSASRTSDCQVTDSVTRVLCLVPEWAFPAAPVRLSLFFGDSSKIAFDPPNASLATFYASWSNVTGGPVEAGGGASLVFTGAGFDASVPLSCVFASRLVPYSALSCAQVVNRTTVTCAAPPFLVGEEAAVAALVDPRTGLEAPFTGFTDFTGVTGVTGDQRRVRFTAGVIEVEPSEGLATGGLVVEVAGFGFDEGADAGVFQCLWTTFPEAAFTVWTGGGGALSILFMGDVTPGDPLAVLANASVASSTRLSCTTPYWGEARAAGNVSLHVLRSGATLPAADAADGTGGVPLTFLFVPSWHSLAPIAGPAGGGGNVTVSGAGFDLEADDAYLCVFSNEHNVTGERAVS
ncbi:hypothetical protein T484DRAFT_1791209, partial [Baffinella frigidus]